MLPRRMQALAAGPQRAAVRGNGSRLTSAIIASGGLMALLHDAHRRGMAFLQMWQQCMWIATLYLNRLAGEWFLVCVSFWTDLNAEVLQKSLSMGCFAVTLYLILLSLKRVVAVVHAKTSTFISFAQVYHCHTN